MPYVPGKHIRASVFAVLSRRDPLNLSEVARAVDYSTTATRATLRALIADGRAESLTLAGGSRLHYRRAGKACGSSRAAP